VLSLGLSIQADCWTVWEAAAIAEKKSRDGKIAEQVKLSEEIEARKKEMRNAGIKPMPGGSL
jgi:hypothetical protein